MDTSDWEKTIHWLAMAPYRFHFLTLEKKQTSLTAVQSADLRFTPQRCFRLVQRIPYNVMISDVLL